VKGSGKIIVFMGIMAFLLVHYVQGQVNLVRISYVLDKKIKIKNDKLEHYRQLKYELDQIKSPRLLESKLGELNFNLTLPTEIKVIRMAPQSSWSVKPANLPEKLSLNPISEKLTNFFERWVQVAQAKTDV